jgi:hypothetical protein
MGNWEGCAQVSLDTPPATQRENAWNRDFNLHWQVCDLPRDFALGILVVLSLLLPFA